MRGKILIVDGVATNRIVLKVKLASASYDTLQAVSGAEAFQIADEAHPDLILLDVDLPDIDGIALCEQFRSNPATRNTPVLMLAARDEPQTRIRALKAGAVEVLRKPVEETVLLAWMRSVLRAREADDELRLRDAARRELGFAEAGESYAMPGTVALVTEQPAEAVLWRQQLAALISDKIVVLHPDDTLNVTATGAVPDVFVIADDSGNSGAGMRLMSELHSRFSTRHAAVSIVLAPQAREAAAMALDLGAGDIISRGVSAEEMALRIRSLLARKRAADGLRASVTDGLRLAVIDPLTGLYNRRYALPYAARISERAIETGRPFAVMVLDIDKFKSVNDTFGHAGGDAVLIEVAARLTANLRNVDLLARIGGEEFLIVLPDTTLEAARTIAERLRQVIEERPMPLPGTSDFTTVTVSIGLAMGGGASARFGTVEMIVDRADQALLGAKSEGRNQVTVSRTAA